MKEYVTHNGREKSAGYETRGCDTPGRFAMDERDGKFSWSYVYFSK